MCTGGECGVVCGLIFVSFPMKSNFLKKVKNAWLEFRLIVWFPPRKRLTTEKVGQYWSVGIYLYYNSAVTTGPCVWEEMWPSIFYGGNSTLKTCWSLLLCSKNVFMFFYSNVSHHMIS